MTYRFNPKTLRYARITNMFSYTRFFLRLIIILAIGFFVTGGILVYFKLFSLNSYLVIGSIVGSLASIVGLISLTSNKLSKQDIEHVGIEYFKDVISAAENLKEKEEILLTKEKQLGAKENQIRELEIKKAELEFIVKKASMVIFLKDQLERTEEKIAQIVSDHKELTNNIAQRERIISQLQELDQEIQKTNNTKIVEDIITMVKSSKKPEVDQPQAFFLQLFKAIANTTLKM